MVVVACALLAGCILAFDLYFPLGVAAGVLYLLVILFAQTTRRTSIVWGSAIACTLLVGLGFVLSTEQTEVWIVLTNRALSILVIWSTAFFSVLRIKAELAFAKNFAETRMLAAIVSSAEDAIISKDSNGTILSWNPAAEKMYGYRPDEVVGRHIEIIVPQERREELAGILKQIVDGKRVEHFETVRVTKDGRRILVSLTVSPLMDGKQILGAAAIARDITEVVHIRTALEQNQSRLQILNEELESFSYSVSHDLRAPLQAIDGFARVLMEDHLDQVDPEGQRLFGVIRNNVRKMGNLIDDLLAFSRLGRKDPEKSELRMTPLVKKIGRELSEDSDNQDLEIIIHDLPDAFGDRALLSQVWINLVGNAIKYSSSHPKPKIEVNGTIEKDEIIYSVHDNGVGFDMAYADKLYGVFQRLHKASEFPGTGVGLALVKRIVLKHEGRVWADSVNNQGAIFHFSLPKKGDGHEQPG